MITHTIAALGLAASTALILAQPATAQSVPGFQVTHYATVNHPVLLSFAPNGVLYSGRDTVASGGSTAQKIHRIGPGGSPVVEIGDAPTPDPDAVLFDAVGTFSGAPGSVLVGGLVPPGTTSGRISAIHPDGTVHTIFESGTMDNPVELKFDNTGRLLFTESMVHAVFVSQAGELPTVLFTYPGSGSCSSYLAIDSRNRIFTCACDGIIRIHAANGTLIDGNFADVQNISAIEFGPGGAFGNDLYALNTTTGTLYRIDADGNTSVFGTGFTNALKDLAVGPDGALYVSRFGADEIVRIAPVCKASGGDLDGDDDVDGIDLATFLGAWGPCPGCCAADLNGDHVVNGIDLALLLGAWG